MFIFKLSLFINCKITYKYSQKGKILKLMHLNLKDLMGTNMYSKHPPAIPPPPYTHTHKRTTSEHILHQSKCIYALFNKNHSGDQKEAHRYNTIDCMF